MKQIVSVRDRKPDEFGYSITKTGEASDGERFDMVKLSFNDGTEGWAWKSTHRTGYFKQVFVSLEFSHPEIIE